MRTRSLAVAAVIVAPGATLALSGAALAAPVTWKSHLTGGTGKGKGKGSVEVTTYRDNDGPGSAAVLTGAIGDYGHAERTHANGQVARNYNRLNFVLSRASFQLEIAGLEPSLVGAADKIPTDLNTCSGYEVIHAATPIAPGSGTGAYRGISGSFNLTVTINEVDGSPNCPTTGQSLITRAVIATGLGVVAFGST